MKSFIKKSGLANARSLIKSSLPGLFVILFLGSLILMQSCRKHDFNPPPFGSYDLKLIADNFVSPVTVVDAPDGTKRLFVVDQLERFG